MVNLNFYKIFCEVVKEKNISKASEKLYISQPAVSFSIKELEKSLGQTLFIRKSKGVELTPFGAILYNKIKDVIDTFDEAEVVANNFSKLNDGIIRIGANSSNVNQILLDYLTRFAKKYPNVQIVMIRDNREKLLEKLDNNELDMVFVDKVKNIDDYNLVKQYNVKYQLIGTKKYKDKYHEDDINLKNFPTLDLILPSVNNNSRTTIENFFIKNNITLHPKYELDNYILLYEFVKQGFGIAFVSANYYKNSINSGEVELIYPNFYINAREIVCLTNKTYYNNAIDKLVEIINS